jgi:hypothetical protein
MRRVGSTAQAVFTARQHNSKQTEKDNAIFNCFVLLTEFFADRRGGSRPILRFFLIMNRSVFLAVAEHKNL